MGNNKPGEHMGFEWIFDVLRDLKSFASANDMPELAHKADEAIAAAKAEIEARHEPPRDRPDQLH
jgi:predicted transcriptional regulator